MTKVPADTPNDEFVLALGAYARETGGDRGHDWMVVAEGHRTADEMAAAAQQRGATDEEIERDRALFSPLSEAERATIREAIATEAGPAPIELRPAGRPERSGLSKAIPWVLTGTLAVAAAALLWRADSPKTPPPAGNETIAAVTLPKYDLEVKRGLVESRSAPPGMAAPGERVIYRADTTLLWVLHPERDVDEAIDLAVFASDGTSTTRLDLSALTETSPTGSIRVQGRADALGLRPGDWTLTIVVAPVGALPSTWPAKSDDPAWRVHTQPVRIEAEPG